MSKKFILVAGVLVAASAHGQVLYTTAGATAAQTFSSLPVNTSNTALASTWVNNTTLTGWDRTSNGAKQSTFLAGSGVTSTGGMYSFGAVNSSDRALGLITNDPYGTSASFGVQLENQTGKSLKGLQVAYTGEQWHRGKAVGQSLVFSYSTDATSLTTGTWTTVSSLSFNALKSGFDGQLDGNAAANRSSLGGFLSPVVAQGNSIWMKWTLGRPLTGSSAGLAVDDFTFRASPVPEPFTMVTLGLGAIGIIARRKKRN